MPPTSPRWKKSLKDLEKEFTVIVQALNLIAELDRSIFLPTFSQDTLLEEMLKGVRNLVKAEYAQILLRRDSRLVIAHSTYEEDKGKEFETKECVCGLAVERRATVSSGNVAEDFPKRYKWILGRDKKKVMVSEVAVPIYAPALDARNGAQPIVVGVINIESPRPNYFTDREIELVEKFARQAATALNNARIYAGLELNLKLAASIQGPAQKPKEALRDTLKELAGLFQQRVIIQFLSYEPESKVLVIESSTVEGTEGKSVLVRDSFSGLAIKQAVGSNDVRRDYPKLFKDTVSDAGHYPGDGRRRTQSELAVPIKHNGNVIGVLNVESSEKEAFSKHDELMLTVIASNAGVWTRFYKSKKELALEKLATVGNVAGHLFHTLEKTLLPLEVIASELQEVSRSVGRPARARILSQVEWLNSIAPSIHGNINKLQDMYAREQIPEEGLDINEVARQVVKEIITRKKDISIVWELQPGMPRLRIPGGIYHVFWNLLSNAQAAFDHGRKGKITVGTKLVSGQYTRQIEACELYVKDNGRGIPEEKLERIRQLDYSSKEGRTGGYGLWWVDTFVDAWEGKLNIESKVGKGTYVHIRLPLTPEGVATPLMEEKKK
ncbi:MAG TPA: GAF domain-containing protein [Pyrinomonadaceae bacterium]|nr:GAF domain-containing protein [Pyrinomonadaceae bacterium]